MDFKVGDVVETIGRYGVARQRGTIVDADAAGSGLMVVDFGNNFRRHRYRDECTLVERKENGPNNAD